MIPHLHLYLAFVVGLAVAVAILSVGRFIYGSWYLLHDPAIWLELTPPAQVDRSAAATEQLFTALHGLGMSRSLSDKILGRASIFSLEVVSTRERGIRYLLRVTADKASALEHTLTAYLPEVKVQQVADYLDQPPRGTVFRFRQRAHFAFPLQSHDKLEHHDPIGYLTSAMTKLTSNELMALQLVVRPVRVPEAERLGHKILSNEDLLTKLTVKRHFLGKLLPTVSKLLFAVADMVGASYHGSSKADYYGAQRELNYEKQVAKRLRPVRTLSYFEHELVESMHHKLAQPLFSVELRAYVAGNKQMVRQRQKSLVAALQLFSVPTYQALVAKRPVSWVQRSWRFWFRRRLPAMFRPANILAASELASLYHFPHPQSAKTENVVKSLSKTLPAPVALKNGTKPDVILGVNSYHGAHTPIGLTAAERERHVYIIGGTGNGKTTMLTSGIIQDIHNGKGVAVVDPHGDLATTLLKHIPKHRIKDVIYLNPRDIDHPIGLNLLELPKNLTGSELEQEKDLITEAIISVLRKVFSEDDTGGHRIEYVLRNTIHTAMTIKDATLFTILKLLTNSEFRKEVSNKLDDQELRDFWKQELGKAGAMQRVKMSAGVTNKIGRFSRSIAAKRMLGQPHSTINFDEILNDSKILICNFSKGRLGEDTSSLFGTAILAQIQLAAWRREALTPEERRPFYLYVDEFQNFAGKPFMQLISEARKYKVFLTMAEQSTSQQDEQRMVETILNNVGTVVCFRTGSPRDEKLLLHQFAPYIEPGDITNLPSFNFYVRIAAVEPYEPMSGHTVLLEGTGSEQVAEQVITHSQTQYGVEYVEEQVPKPTTKPIDNRKRRSKQHENLQIPKTIAKSAKSISV